jgi:hypothetical protein
LAYEAIAPVLWYGELLRIEMDDWDYDAYPIRGR